MSIRVLAAAVLLTGALAPAAVAQEAAPPAIVAPAEDGARAPEILAAEARVEAAGEALKPVLDSLRLPAEAIRSDPTLSDEVKAARIRALVDPHREQIDAFGAELEALILLEAASEGVPAEVIAGMAAQMRQMMDGRIEAALISGDTGEGEDDADEVAAPAA